MENIQVSRPEHLHQAAFCSLDGEFEACWGERGALPAIIGWRCGAELGTCLGCVRLLPLPLLRKGPQLVVMCTASKGNPGSQ